jgi:pimeloyl-ACP methyl ester carboxylesterase
MISKTIELAGTKVHYADFGGRGPAIVLVHGLGASHTNWLSVGPALSQLGRTIALDLPGFGRSERSPRGSTIDAMGEALALFIDALSPGPVHLVGSSLGGALVALERHARPHRVASTLLVCPALPARLGDRLDPKWMLTMLTAAAPGGHVLLRRHVARIGPERSVREMLALCCVDPSRVSLEVVHAEIALATERARMPWNEEAFAQASRSLLALLLTRRRVAEALRTSAPPMRIVHGQRDRLVDVNISRAVASSHPHIGLDELPGVGHFPHVEAPAVFLGAARPWLEGAIRPTSGSA